MPFKPEDVYQLKGKAITNFAYIEVVISTFIVVHYFGVNNKYFHEEVLEHEYFSFELKKRILYKLLKTHYSTHSFPNKKLDRLQELRNLIAHGSIAGKVLGPKKVEPLLRHQGKNHDIKTTFKEWDDLMAILNPAVKELPKIKLSTVDAPFDSSE